MLCAHAARAASGVLLCAAPWVWCDRGLLILPVYEGRDSRAIWRTGGREAGSPLLQFWPASMLLCAAAATAGGKRESVSAFVSSCVGVLNHTDSPGHCVTLIEASLSTSTGAYRRALNSVGATPPMRVTISTHMHCTPPGGTASCLPASWHSVPTYTMCRLQTSV